jgi:glucose-6-phosphate 1-dehydrogenase
MPSAVLLSAQEVEATRKELERLRAENAELKGRFEGGGESSSAITTQKMGQTTTALVPDTLDFDQPLSYIIFGATGDLAKKKLFPALATLIREGRIPENCNIIGYGRSAFENQAFIDKQCVNVKGTDEEKAAFFERVTYVQGGYDSVDDMVNLDNVLKEKEGSEAGVKGNRVFFLSVPPTIFGGVCKCVKANAFSNAGFSHMVIEKPFGRDAESFAELNETTSTLFREDQLFRIDHYMAKEVVLNILTLRFANRIFEPIWNNQHIASVQIIFKEDLGTGGRGGYFDTFGIIRDIMQNHLLQVFNFLAMEAPASLSAPDIAAKKKELLQSVAPIVMDDVLLGQFTKNTFRENHQVRTEPGYKDDPGVPDDSCCPTFAMACLRVNNPRWQGVPFLFSAGKGMDERKCEVRITFKPSAQPLFQAAGEQQNELVLRIQPNEAIYMKTMNKVPGLQYEAKAAVLDMSYAQQFPQAYAGDAYERMMLNAAKGDNSLFVGSEELVEAWRIFTPLLHQIDNEKPKPLEHKFGTRGPAEADAFAHKLGIELVPSWREFLGTNPEQVEMLRKVFDQLTTGPPGRKFSSTAVARDEPSLSKKGVEKLATIFYDGRKPPTKLVDAMMDALDSSGTGMVTWKDLQQASHLLLEEFGTAEEGKASAKARSERKFSTYGHDDEAISS